jgi:ribonuclease J
MNLIIHRGTNEIGGSCIEIATNKSRVLIDIGLPLDFDNKTKEQKYKR